MCDIFHGLTISDVMPFSYFNIHTSCWSIGHNIVYSLSLFISALVATWVLANVCCVWTFFGLTHPIAVKNINRIIYCWSLPVLQLGLAPPYIQWWNLWANQAALWTPLDAHTATSWTWNELSSHLPQSCKSLRSTKSRKRLKVIVWSGEQQ